MSDDEDIAALVVDNGSGMCKGEWRWWKSHTHDTIDRGHFVFELFDFLSYGNETRASFLADTVTDMTWQDLEYFQYRMFIVYQSLCLS